jgi:broad specificity phosphatase PhoE
MRLYIIRHAEPDYPRDTLTAHGHAQAQALAHRLAGTRIGRVYSSPMTRALETARYTAERLGLDVQVEPWTRELEDWWIPDPAVGELPVWQVDAATLRAMPDLGQAGWLRDGLAQLRSSADDFLARHGYFRDGTSYRIENAPSHDVAVFCHAGFALTWLADLLAIPLPRMWAAFSLSPCSVTTMVFEQLAGGEAAARCVSLGDEWHLLTSMTPS